MAVWRSAMSSHCAPRSRAETAQGSPLRNCVRIVWFIRNADWVRDSLDAIVGQYQNGVADVERTLPDTLSPTARVAWDQRTTALVMEGAPEDLARRLAALQDLVAAP